MTQLDNILHRTLLSFAAEALDGSWTGRREREAVSLFVFGHLLREVNPMGFLRDPAQIGIEFPVPQLDVVKVTAISGRTGSKLQVCKDVVIWSKPRMTCWDSKGCPTVAPSAILEWKFNAPAVYGPDVAWLQSFSATHSGFVGYAITANPPGGRFKLSCTRVEEGEIEPEWLFLA